MLSDDDRDTPTDADPMADPKVQALLSYARHDRSCDMMSAFIDGKSCTCGFDAALAAFNTRIDLDGAA